MYQEENEWVDGNAVGDEVGKASATESLLRFSILPVTNLSSALWEKAVEAERGTSSPKNMTD